jgi:hypothetical protein
MLAEQGRAFADQWIKSWNARDVEAVLEHFADDVTFTSPTAARLIPASGGLIRGKQALRDYWSDALGRNPDLRFELLGTYIGVDTVVINFRHQTGVVATEVLIFAGSLVVSGHAAHLAAP